MAHTVNAAATIMTRKRLRTEYSISLSIMELPLVALPLLHARRPSAFLQFGDDVLARVHFEAPLDLLPRLEALKQFWIVDGELHLHALHEARYIFVIELHRRFVRVHGYYLALDGILFCRRSLGLVARATGKQRGDRQHEQHEPIRCLHEIGRA